MVHMYVLCIEGLDRFIAIPTVIVTVITMMNGYICMYGCMDG